MARAPRDRTGDTASQILDVAEQLVQTRGFNGFSYADVAHEVKVTTATLHYHFPGKGELGRALIGRYANNFFAALQGIEAQFADAPRRLQAYAGLYSRVLFEQKLCLCGMLAAEYHTLPAPMRDAVVSFFDENEAWLGRVLEEGRQQASLEFSGSAADTARMIISALEGAMLVSRPYGDAGRFEAASAQLLASLTRSAQPAPGRAGGGASV